MKDEGHAEIGACPFSLRSFLKQKQEKCKEICTFGPENKTADEFLRTTHTSIPTHEA